MTRYNDEIDLGEYDLDGYRAGVNRVLWFLNDWDGEGELIRDIQKAIAARVI